MVKLSTDFIFDELTQKDVQGYVDKAYVFNRSKEQIEKEKVVLNLFSDESLGDSVEKLDVAVKFGDGEWNLLNINDKIESYNEIPLGYLLNDIKYDKVLIILRRMSNFLYDKTTGSSNSYIYSIVRDEYKMVSKFPSLSGMLASKRIYLDKSYDELVKDIREKWDGTDAEDIVKALKIIVGE